MNESEIQEQLNQIPKRIPGLDQTKPYHLKGLGKFSYSMLEDLISSLTVRDVFMHHFNVYRWNGRGKGNVAPIKLSTHVLTMAQLVVQIQKSEKLSEKYKTFVRRIMTSFGGESNHALEDVHNPLLLRSILLHDAAEIITGDIPHGGKNIVINKDELSRVEGMVETHFFGGELSQPLHKPLDILS